MWVNGIWNYNSTVARGKLAQYFLLPLQFLILTLTPSHRHYPTTKFTSVSDTPENLRLKKQTAQQSDVSANIHFLLVSVQSP